MPEMDEIHSAVLDLLGLDALVRSLADQGYRVIGPVVRDGAVVYDDVGGVADLPAGWGDDQEAGRYRLHRRDDDAVFGYAVGPQSPRRFFTPPRSTLWSATKTENGFEIDPPPVGDSRPLALLGVRGCELAAIAVQDHVAATGGNCDGARADARAFIVAVNCTEPASTCFCTSMGTGPTAGPGHDLALTELLDGGGHRFVARVGTERGARTLAAVPHRAVIEGESDAALAAVAEAAGRMQRHLAPGAARDLLAANLDHPQWDDVAQRCLSCGNCTLVCPTCFCSDVEDVTDLTGSRAERVERWDSCFTLGHSYMHGGSVRADVRARYRQWLTHKLSTWWDQFGESGCVGCGRCIAWCPVGIDLTAEVAAIGRAGEVGVPT